METSLFNRAQATLLALATAALFVLAVFNLLQERQFQQPDDGVWWSEASGGLQAQKVLVRLQVRVCFSNRKERFQRS